MPGEPKPFKVPTNFHDVGSLYRSAMYQVLENLKDTFAKMRRDGEGLTLSQEQALIKGVAPRE